MTNIAAPKIPDGEKVDFDVSRSAIETGVWIFFGKQQQPKSKSDTHVWLWSCFSDGRTSTGSVKRKISLSYSPWSRLISSRGRKRKRSSSLLLTESWVCPPTKSVVVRVWSNPPLAACVSVTGETPYWESRAAEDPGGEREGEAGQTGGELTVTLTQRLSSQTHKDGFPSTSPTCAPYRRRRSAGSWRSNARSWMRTPRRRRPSQTWPSSTVPDKRSLSLQLFNVKLSEHTGSMKASSKPTCSIRVTRALVTKKTDYSSACPLSQ